MRPQWLSIQLDVMCRDCSNVYFQGGGCPVFVKQELQNIQQTRYWTLFWNYPMLWTPPREKFQSTRIDISSRRRPRIKNHILNHICPSPEEDLANSRAFSSGVYVFWGLFGCPVIPWQTASHPFSKALVCTTSQWKEIIPRATPLVKRSFHRFDKPVLVPCHLVNTGGDRNRPNGRTLNWKTDLLTKGITS